MCLSSVEKFRPCRKGYKIMMRYSYGLRGQYRNIFEFRELGVWLDEELFRATKEISTVFISAKSGYYPVGWHTFHTKKDALEHLRLARKRQSSWYWVLVEVSVRKPIVVGLQHTSRGLYKKPIDCKVTVSKEIRIDKVDKEEGE